MKFGKFFGTKQGLALGGDHMCGMAHIGRQPNRQATGRSHPTRCSHASPLHKFAPLLLVLLPAGVVRGAPRAAAAAGFRSAAPRAASGHGYVSRSRFWGDFSSCLLLASLALRRAIGSSGLARVRAD